MRGIQAGFGESIAGVLPELRARGFTPIRVVGVGNPAWTREVLDAGLRPLTIVMSGSELEDLPPGSTDAELGNEPDIKKNGWTPERYVTEARNAIGAALANGVHLWLGAVSNLNNRGFTFLRAIPWHEIPSSIGCSVHRYPERSGPHEGHEGRTRDQEVAELKAIIGDRPFCVSEVGYSNAEWSEEESAAHMAFERDFWQRHGAAFVIAYQINDGPGSGVLDHYGFRRRRDLPDGSIEWSWKPVADVWTAPAPQPEPEPEPEPVPDFVDVLVPVGATVGSITVSGTLTVRVPKCVHPEPEPPPLQDLHVWVTDTSDRGISGAAVTINGDTRITSGEGHTHFPVTGPVQASIAAEGYLERSVELQPGERRVALARVQPPPVTLQRLHVESNARWFANQDGSRFDWREVTAFGLYALWLQGKKAEAHAFIRRMRELDFTVLRVIFTLDNEYWQAFDRVCRPDMPGYWTELRPFLELCARESLHVRAVMIGDLTPFGGEPDWVNRPDIYTGDVQRRAEEFCMRFTQEVRDYPHVCDETSNEYIQIGMRDSADKLVALSRRLKQLAPQTLLCGGSPDGADDQRVDFIRYPLDWCDAHIERRMACAGFEWVKRSGEYMPIDQPLTYPHDHPQAGQPTGIQKHMPFVSGEPVNFGENRLDGRTGDVEKSLAVAFCYGAVSRSRQYNACFHWDGGLWANPPKPETVASMSAFMQGLNAFPMLTGTKWRGHWAESFFRGDIYPAQDDDRTVLAHVDAGKGPWRVFGCGDYAATICEPANWDYRQGLKPGANADLIARVQSNGYASGVYRRR